MTKIDYPISWRITNERESQDRKWGEQNHNDYVWNAILTEEVGEVSKAILESRDSGIGLDAINVDELEKELVQVAAVCVAWLEAIERRN